MNSYMVGLGDSLRGIAKTFGTTISALLALNDLREKESLFVGQRLNIPEIFLPERSLRRGSVGREVARIQMALAAIGYNLRVDGVYGLRTAHALDTLKQKFPEDQAADGIYDALTKKRLESLLRSHHHILRSPDDIGALINKHNSLPADYVPRNLVVPRIPFPFQEFHPKKQLRQEAAFPLEQLVSSAKSVGISLFGASGYRSYGRQAEIFAQNIWEDPGANRYSARPGESEHQTGLAMDVTAKSVGFLLTAEFGETSEGKWLAANAPAFGFIIRYPCGKEGVTGYDYEPWHLRYVGISGAREMADEGLVLEEYT